MCVTLREGKNSAGQMFMSIANARNVPGVTIVLTISSNVDRGQGVNDKLERNILTRLNL